MSVKFWLDNKFDNLKWKIQRFKKGYSDVDVWNINYWFLDIMPRMLKEMREDHCGYPGTKEVPTNEDWERILDEMIFYFSEANEDTCSQKNEFEDKYTTDIITHKEDKGSCRLEFIHSDDGIFKKWLDRENEIAYYRIDMEKKGLELFVKYFRHLWD